MGDGIFSIFGYILDSAMAERSLTKKRVSLSLFLSRRMGYFTFSTTIDIGGSVALSLPPLTLALVKGTVVTTLGWLKSL